MKKICFLLYLLLPLSVYSKEWTIWNSEVEIVPEDNYYNIALPPELTGQSKYADFPGIRLYNSQGTVIPHFIRSGNIREESSVHYSTLTLLPVTKVSQKDSSDHFTYLTFPTLKNSYWYDKVVFYVTYPGDYYRKGKTTDNRYSFTLSSYQSNTFFPGMQRLTPETTFRISNEQNPPLVIDSVHFYTVPYYVCAFLSAGERYTLTLDESLDGRPSYDIEHFRNKIPEDIPVISITTPVATVNQTTAHTRDTLWIENPAVLWSIIILVGIFLIGICFFVMKDMKKK